MVCRQHLFKPSGTAGNPSNVVQRVRKTAMTIAANCGAKPDLLVVELGMFDLHRALRSDLTSLA